MARDGVWKILVVDDDADIQQVTRLVLEDFTFLGHRVELLTADSAAGGYECVRDHPDIAVAIIDVVMETRQAGLDLVRRIREELGNRMLRIILRTGQPGAAPEKEVVIRYDINDYKEKTELTFQKLETAVITALRSFSDLQTIEDSRAGLEKIVRASAGLFRLQAMKSFASGLLEQMVALLHLRSDAMLGHVSSMAAGAVSAGAYTIYSGMGDFSRYVDMTTDAVDDEQFREDVARACASESGFREGDRLVAWFKTSTGASSIVYIRGIQNLSELDERLLDVFCSNISIAFDNLCLKSEIEDSQRAIILSLGEAIDMRSCETGAHVYRVSTLSKMIAEQMGFEPNEAEKLAQISPMHDVGKITIPDAILSKPGKLSVLEYEQMKQHTLNGYRLLAHSGRELLRDAAVIALQHHERHDGMGYPSGLSGEEISVSARIVALVDVFDALVSDRVYKKAWPLRQALEYIRSQRGLQFHPAVVDAFLSIADRPGTFGSIRGDGAPWIPDERVDPHPSAPVSEPAAQTAEPAAPAAEPRPDTFEEMAANIEAIIGNSHDAIIIHAPDGHFLQVNDRMLEMYGCTRQQAMTLKVSDISSESSSMDLVRVYWENALSGRTSAFEWEGRRFSDGVVFPVTVSLIRYIWHGQPAILATVRDISPFRAAQERIRVGEERLEMAMYATNHGVWDWWLREGRVLFDVRCYQMAGYDFGEFPNTIADWEARIHPDDLVTMCAAVDRFMEGDSPTLDEEYRFIRKDGEIMWIHAVGKIVERNANGQPVRFVGTNEDVTERRRAEAELQQQRIYTNAVMDSVPGLLYLYGAEGHLIRWNRKHEELTGYSAEELSHMTLADWYVGSPDDWERIQRGVGQAFETGYAEEEGHLTMKDGSKVLFHFNAVRLELDGRTCIAGIGIDCTERTAQMLALEDALRKLAASNETLEARVRERTAQLEQMNSELEAKMEALELAESELIRSERLASLGELVAGVAHEINTPIGVSVTAGSFLDSYVRDFRQRLDPEAMNPELDRFVNKCADLSGMILSNLERAARLIRGFKQVSVDRTHDVERVLNLKEYMNEIVVSLAPAMKKTPHRLVNAIESDIWLSTYPGAIAQIVSNLTMNALQHAFHPEMEGVAIVTAAERAGEVTIVFRDNGVGIPPDIRKHIFDPFFTTRRSEGGTGLGLFIVHNLVTNQLKGTIDCHSAPNEGTEFRLRLPKGNAGGGPL